jgi:DNA-binding NarL/FixJ family response regulator
LPTGEGLIVLELLAEGLSNAGIAERLFVSTKPSIITSRPSWRG